MNLVSRVSALFPGIVLLAVIAMASSFIADHYGGPTSLYALLIGVALSAASDDPRMSEGLRVSAEVFLPIGIALAGLSVTFSEIAALGASTVAITLAVMALTIAAGLLVGGLVGSSFSRSAIYSAAVAVCGSSAALAVASLFPQTAQTRRNTTLAIVVVTGLSTAAMILYPAIAGVAMLDEVDTGVFLGATIHAVAQAVAAGFSVSDTAGAVATVVKLLRVAGLIPVVFVFSLYLRVSQRAPDAVEAHRPKLVPYFLIGFAGCVLLANLVKLPTLVTETASSVSQTLILLAVCAIGVQTSIKTMFSAGSASILMMTGLTVFLAAACLGLLAIF
jgi:uncharacterized integral membrane protein (TIGR00698 family)